MQYSRLGRHNDIAYITADTVVMQDAQSALDMMASVQYKTGCDKMIINKSCVIEDFFVLSSGIAGEILQKFSTYRKKIAIIGDFSNYTSKPLKDFIYESNNGNCIYFLPDIEQAIRMLDNAQ